jgi:hypothetical protein
MAGMLVSFSCSCGCRGVLLACAISGCYSVWIVLCELIVGSDTSLLHVMCFRLLNCSFRARCGDPEDH